MTGTLPPGLPTGLAGPAAPTLAPAKALLVDDRRDNLIALEAMLQGLPLEAVAVESGEAALKQLLVDDFALILLDAQMPDMDGFETASHIKRREKTRHVPIIFLTAADRDARLALRGYAAGAVDYLTKPFDPWVLRAKVSIFVDLWAKTQQLRAQAERYGQLATAVEQALTLLREPDVTPQTVEQVRDVLARAKVR
jgi:CheY-like chemotaxis protein